MTILSQVVPPHLEMPLCFLSNIDQGQLRSSGIYSPHASYFFARFHSAVLALALQETEIYPIFFLSYKTF